MRATSGVAATGGPRLDRPAEPAEPAAPTGPAEPAGPGGLRGRALRAARRFGPVLGLYALVKTAGFAVFMYLLERAGDYDVRQAGRGGGGRAWDVLGSWDGLSYQDIAAHGYHPQVLAAGAQVSDVELNTAAFFPLYPGLIGLVSKVTGLGPYGAGMLVSVVCSFVAAAGVYAVVALLAGHRAGVAAGGLWALAPGSGVEWAVYSESLFVAIAAWACYAVMKRRWVTAGLLALVSGLNRPTSAALIAAVGVAALIALWKRTDGVARPLFAILATPWGLLGYLAWVGWRMHEPTGYFMIQKAWEHYFDGGRFTFLAIPEIMIARYHYLWAQPMADTLALVVLLAVPVLLVLLFRLRPPVVLLVFTVLTIASTVLSQQIFSNIPRYLLPAFPLLIAPAIGAARLKRPTLVALTVFVGAASGWYGGYVLFELGTP